MIIVDTSVRIDFLNGTPSREARRAGITVRKTLDPLIAVPCMRTGLPLLHNDRDFDLLASFTELEILRLD